MRTYVSTMGFHETRVTRPVLRHDLANEDRVILVRPDVEADGSRGNDAVKHVTDMLHEISPGAEVKIEEIDQSDFETAVFQCCEILDEVSGELIVNFGGGAREIFLPLTIATVLFAPKVDTALQYTDVDQSVRDWEVPNLSASIQDEWWTTLGEIEDVGPDVSIPDLEGELDATKSTISRHVSGLNDAELVRTTMRGKTKHVSTTLAGRLRLLGDDR